MAEKVERRLAAILSADVVGYARLIGADEEGTLARLAAHRAELIDAKFTEHRGRIVKVMGDGVLVEFASVVDAVRCAAGIQRGMAARSADEPEERRIVLRIGINLGDIVVAGDDIHGDGVNVAARMEQLAEPGGISISGDAYRQVEGKVDVGFADLGERTVKNIARPIHVYRVLLQPEAAGTLVTRGKTKTGSATRRWAIPAAAAAVVVAIAAAVLLTLEPWVKRIDAAIEANMAFPLPDRPSMVVLPFDNVGGDPEQDFFADGLTGDIIAHLSTWPGLFVIDRASSFSYRGKATTAKQVAEELAVRHVLQGSVQRSGETLRINTQLIDALSGRHVWSERYNRNTSDLFALQDEITRHVSVALDVELLGGEGARAFASRSGDNVQAWEYGARAAGHLRRGIATAGAAEFARARELWRKAIDVGGEQSNFVTGLATTHYLELLLQLSDDPGGSFARLVEQTKKARGLDDSDPLVHSLLGGIAGLERRHDDAIRHLQRAVALSPSLAPAHVDLGYWLNHAGRFDEAITRILHGMRLSPYYPDYFLLHLGSAYFNAGRLEDAREALESLVERDPENGWAYLILAGTHWELGNEEAARREIGGLLEMWPHFTVTYIRGSLLYKDRRRVDYILDILRLLGVPEHPPLPLPDKPSIAVLPFANMSDDPEQEWFADGMTDDLITDLSKISGQFVIARNSSFVYKGRAVDVKTVGRELGVKFVLEGSVRRAADRVRINAQLIDASSGGHVWAERYDGRLTDMFALQDRVTRRIVAAMSVELTEQEQQAAAVVETDSIAAHDAFVQGWQHLQRETEEDYGKAKSYFEKAIELDPDYARANTALAFTYLEAARRGWYGAVGIEVSGVGNAALQHGWSDAATWAAAHLEVSIESAETPLAYAVSSFLRWTFFQYDLAIVQAERAVVLGPNHHTVQAMLGQVFVFAGQPARAIRHFETAMRLNPHHPAGYLEGLGIAHFAMNELEQAATLFERALQRNPDLWYSFGFLAATYAHLGRDEEAAAAMQKWMAGAQVALGFVPDTTLPGINAPYKDGIVEKRWMHGLRKAGLDY